MVVRSACISIFVALCLASCSSTDDLGEADDAAAEVEAPPTNTIVLPVYDVTWTPPEPPPPEVIETDFVLVAPASLDGQPITIKVERFSPGAERATSVTMRWGEGDEGLAALSIGTTGPDCAEQSDAEFEAITIRSGIEACTFSNDVGLTFVRWRERELFLQFQAVMPADASVAFIESLREPTLE